MHNYIVLDFETQDDWIDEGRGSGWPEKQAKFLCAAMHYVGGIKYFDNVNYLLEELEGLVQHSPLAIVAHNAQYEAGVLMSYGFDIESVTWIDTMILAKLYYNNLHSFSLDSLCKQYLGREKSDGPLGEIAQELGLVKTSIQDPVKIAKKHMEKVFEKNPQIVRTYVENDVKDTLDLFNYFMDNLQPTKETIEFHSDLIKALTISRSKGVRVHIPTAHKVKKLLEQKERDVQLKITQMIPDSLNIQSSPQLAVYFTAQGVEIPVTEKGNPSITKQWMEECEHPLAKLIIDAKKYRKYIRDFIEPVLRLTTRMYGCVRVYPEIKIYGAAATGRASCVNPNLQQIPKRDPDGALVRMMYLPEEGEQWASLDFSAQEPRLQVHYATKIGAPGAKLLQEAYVENPHLDLHQKVATLAGIERKTAKTINLGLAYGMGDKKLADSLKLTEAQARALRRKFNTLTPFLHSLEQFSKKIIKTRGHLLTLGGRKLYNEVGFERKALNKLIQGGSADQMWAAIVACYRAGIPFLFPVHDSLELSVKSMDTVKEVKNIMETVIPLVVPSVAEVEVGESWGTLEKLEE
jgi:DNA polymerase-1